MNSRSSFHAGLGNNEFDRSLLKGTSEKNFQAPKEKHIRVLVQALQDNNPRMAPGIAFSRLTELLASGQWIKVLKVQLILHRGIDTGSKYGQRLADLNMPFGNIPYHTAEARLHKPILTSYWKYIRSYALNASRLRSMFHIRIVSRSEAINKLNTNELKTEAQLFLKQLKNLVRLGPMCYNALKSSNCGLIREITSHVLRDADDLYSTLTLVMKRLTQHFYFLTPETAREHLKFHTRFDECTRGLWQFFEAANQLQITDIVRPEPYIRLQELVESMRQHAKVEDTQAGLRYLHNDSNILSTRNAKAKMHSRSLSQNCEQAPTMTEISADTNSIGEKLKAQTSLPAECPASRLATETTNDSTSLEQERELQRTRNREKECPENIIDFISPEQELEIERARNREREMEWERERLEMQRRQQELCQEKAMLEQQASRRSLRFPMPMTGVPMAMPNTNVPRSSVPMAMPNTNVPMNSVPMAMPNTNVPMNPFTMAMPINTTPMNPVYQPLQYPIYMTGIYPPVVNPNSGHNRAQTMPNMKKPSPLDLISNN